VLAAFSATLVAGLLAGLLPAVVASGRPAAPGGGSRATRGRSSTRLHAGLAVTQLALAVVLVTGAALLGESLGRLNRVPMGFETDVLTFEVSLPRAGYPDAASWEVYRTDLAEAVAALPGVAAVGSSSRLPLAEHTMVGWWVEAYERSEQEPRITGALLVSADYFAAMGVPIVEGRTFGSSTGAEPEIILSRSLARELFPLGNAVGARVLIHRGDDPAPSVVVGVVGDVRSRGPALEAGDPAVFYEPLDAVAGRSTIGVAVRAEGDPAALAAAIREAAARVDPSVPVFLMRTTGEAVSGTLAAQRAVGALSALFGAGAALLSALGIYGVVAQGVARRRRELGIRLALGAEAADLVRSTLASGARLAMVGVLAGAAAALYATRLLERLLLGIDTADPRTFAAAVAGLGLVALIASYVPARRAARADPLESLRAE
jgi:putative ABC transport system permease protein